MKGSLVGQLGSLCVAGGVGGKGVRHVNCLLVEVVDTDIDVHQLWQVFWTRTLVMDMVSWIYLDFVSW